MAFHHQRENLCALKKMKQLFAETNFSTAWLYLMLKAVILQTRAAFRLAAYDKLENTCLTLNLLNLKKNEVGSWKLRWTLRHSVFATVPYDTSTPLCSGRFYAGKNWSETDFFGNSVWKKETGFYFQPGQFCRNTLVWLNPRSRQS